MSQWQNNNNGNRQNCEDKARILDPEFAITSYLHSYSAKNS